MERFTFDDRKTQETIPTRDTLPTSNIVPSIVQGVDGSDRGKE